MANTEINTSKLGAAILFVCILAIWLAIKLTDFGWGDLFILKFIISNLPTIFELVAEHSLELGMCSPHFLSHSEWLSKMLNPSFRDSEDVLKGWHTRAS